MSSVPLLRIEALSKSYAGVRALDQVSMSIKAGEVHALCGENGAGKSTLIKILSGVVSPDSGTVYLNEDRLQLADVRASEQAGIAVIHQESTAFPDLNAVDNLFVGREIRRWSWQLDTTAMNRQAKDMIQALGESFDLQCPVSELSLAQRQMVSIARALIGQCRLLIMDEPTASLSARETEILFKLIRRLRGEGISILYVSHRLEEIFELADQITVLRDGRWVATRAASEFDRSSLIEMMVGRQVEAFVAKSNSPSTTPSSNRQPILEVRGLTRRNQFHEIDFLLYPGEVLGLAGLVGAGRSEVARSIFGIDPYDEGQVVVQGHTMPQGSVQVSLKSGLALVPEDRQHEGLVLPLSIRSNVSLVVLNALRRMGRILFAQERQIVEQQLNRLDVKFNDLMDPAETLSGGNQQKLVLGKWLASEPKILILDEPTRGIDVGAKAQFHQLIRELAASGVAILLISSEMPELLALSDRLMVMRAGRIVGELNQSDADQERILQMALPDSPSVVGAGHV